MKNLHFLVYSLIVTTPFTAHTRLFEIIAEDGTPINVSESQTVQEFFQKCREDHHCFSQNLALDFNDQLIKEGSSQANRTLSNHSSFWSSNQGTVTSLRYPQRKSDNFIEFLANVANAINKAHNASTTLIEVEAPNHRIKKCSINESPADFFRKCRNSGDCSNPLYMILRYGNLDIKEDSPEANRPFSSFHSNSKFAQARYR